MQRVVFVTSHYLNSDRKAGFHWLADALWRDGWHVLFFTESLSWLSHLRRDARCKYSLWSEAGQLIYVRDRLASYVWRTPFHPVNMRFRLANRLSAPLLRLYPKFSLGPAEAEIAKADLFIFDSDHGLFLVDRFRSLNPRARFVYRVSDDIRMMGHHPLLPEQENRIVGQFDLISVPSAHLRQRFADLANVEMHHHGLDRALFDLPHANPYRTPAPNVLYVGQHHFDADFLARAVRLLPAWSFHIFGAVGTLPTAANLVCHGERPFAELAPYLQHADIGLQCLAYTPGAEAFTDSLKMFQYTYCRLPIVAPSFLRQERPHVFYYEPGDDACIRRALLDARGYDRTHITATDVATWDDLALRLAAPVTGAPEIA